MNDPSTGPLVVIDTNVVLSALVFTRGRLAPIRQAWTDGRIVPLVARVTLAELVRALAYPKFGLNREDRQELLADYLPWCQTVTLPESHTAARLPACRDPHDLPFLHLALVGEATALITGDKDLLELSGALPCPIVSAEQFLRTRLG